MEAVSGSGETPVEKGNLNAPFETWAAVDATYARYFSRNASIEDISAALEAHAETLPAFIETYLEESEDPQPLAIAKLHHILIGIHQEPFEANITANHLDRSAFIILDREQIEAKAQKLIAIAEERKAGGEKIDITGSIFGELAKILKYNNRALIDPVEKRREERKKRIQNTKEHVYDVGKAVVGGVIGASLYNRIRSRKNAQ